MEECESLDPDMTELQESQSDALEAVSQDDEDEVEELQNRCFIYWILKPNCGSLYRLSKWCLVLED